MVLANPTVSVCTPLQAMYQMLDPGFVGLIFSVFNVDSTSKTGQIQVWSHKPF